MRAKLESMDEVSVYAGNASGEFFTNAATDAVNAVTWGSFPRKESVSPIPSEHTQNPSNIPASKRLTSDSIRIITPTIIEAVSFKAWLDEAFGIWQEWQRVYPPQSPTAKLLREVKEGYWLVNVIHHEYVEREALWELLL